ncbi:MAG: nucleotidyltransferase [Muribaculaceae bacterium]|nr:nucleotidyltransferase [Muribaculaceae bacterium]MBR5435587.1 nucleotidyltransferase [Muribaculaceae bacterium]
MKPTLLVLAAGMGSRYGGLKQLDKLGPNGATIMDYSIYDAIRSGFGKVVFVIRKDFENDFRQIVLSKYTDSIPTEVVFQSLDSLPDGFKCPTERTKPWGTNHAIMMGQTAINEPFAVINADDFYGRNTFEVMAKELSRPRDRKGDFCMVAFEVGNTMSESGTVARGVCEVKDDQLVTVVERTAIGYNDKHEIVFTDENGMIQHLTPETPVSMNMWGFTPDYFDYSNESFVEFLSYNINVPKAEFFIPMVVNEMMTKGLATVKVLKTKSRWFGVTYAEDREGVVEKLARMHAEGEYPDKMF